MPTIPYIIQKNVQRLVNGRRRWFVKYETVSVDVSDEVAEYLAKNDKYEQDYQARMKRYKRKAKIYEPFSLDVAIQLDDGSEIQIGELIADRFNLDNSDPLEIIMAKETIYERIRGIKYEGEEEKKSPTFMEVCASKMTKKQYEVWRYHKSGYSNVAIARLLKIDESSVRERLKNAKKRIEKIKSK
jgi:hypothetical protein